MAAVCVLAIVSMATLALLAEVRVALVKLGRALRVERVEDAGAGRLALRRQARPALVASLGNGLLPGGQVGAVAQLRPAILRTFARVREGADRRGERRLRL